MITSGHILSLRFSLSLISMSEHPHFDVATKMAVERNNVEIKTRTGGA